ncbi:Proton extrusion protein PcxA [Coccomyxa sp. Obi]|nr:Proton extrusion protein PcxA [Coccomyxa sp. Obi]
MVRSHTSMHNTCAFSSRSAWHRDAFPRHKRCKCNPVATRAAGKDRDWGSSGGARNRKPRGPPGMDPAAEDDDWDDWGDWGEPKVLSDWVDEGQAARRNGKPSSQSRRRGRRRRDRDPHEPPRDEYLRPMVDTQGIKYRIGLNEDEVTEDIREEFEENQRESWAALKFAGVLLGVPIVVGFTVSRILAEPFYEVAQRYNPQVFAVSDREKVEGAKLVHRHELRLRMDAAIGRAPPISDMEMQMELRREALHIAEEFREHNRAALLNLLSDSTTAVTGFALLLRNSEGRGALFRTIGRIFSGFSDTAKAFLIIASTDILLGYHSEEGWTAAIHLLTGHYGLEVEEAPIYVFVAIVPVTMDAFFKLWIFQGLNRSNPAAAVTLRSMDRH